jgi:hypothetical protein
VGTSFTGYRDQGFWTRDAALETVLALLVLELAPLARQDRALDEILDIWTIQSVAGFGGCVSADLDEHLTSHPALAAEVTAALGRIRERLPAAGIIEVTSPDLARRADRACEGQSWYVPGALATWTSNVTDALRDLIAGRLPPPAGGSWFVDGDGRHLRPTRQLLPWVPYPAQRSPIRQPAQRHIGAAFLEWALAAEHMSGLTAPMCLIFRFRLRGPAHGPVPGGGTAAVTGALWQRPGGNRYSATSRRSQPAWAGPGPGRLGSR